MPANVFRRLRIVSSVSSAAAASRVLPAPAASFPSFLAADTTVAGCVELAMSPAAADAAAGGAAELQSINDLNTFHRRSFYLRTILFGVLAVVLTLRHLNQFRLLTN